MTIPKKKPAAEPPGEAGFSLISNEKLIALYTAMLKCRTLQEHLYLAKKKKRRTETSDYGCEAIFAGAIIDLHAKDSISTSEESVAPGFLKGVPLKSIVSGSARGAAAAGLIPHQSTVDGRLDAALRLARLNKQQRNKKLVVVFSDSGPTWRDTASEFLRVASAKKLPVLFICDGTGEKDDCAPKSHESGVPVMIVDGHDVVAVYRVVSEAITHARRGNGPTLIECRPWAIEEAGRRRRKSGDAIRNMEKYLAGKKLFNQKFKSGALMEFKKELDEAVAATKKIVKRSAKRGSAQS